MGDNHSEIKIYYGDHVMNRGINHVIERVKSYLILARNSDIG